MVGKIIRACAWKREPDGTSTLQDVREAPLVKGSRGRLVEGAAFVVQSALELAELGYRVELEVFDDYAAAGATS